VTIALTNRIVVAGKTIYVTCDPVADVLNETYDPATGTYLFTTSTVALSSCDVNVQTYGSQYYQYSSITVPAGAVVPIVLPPLDVNDTVYIYANGTTSAGGSAYRNLYFTNSDLTNNQSMLIKLKDDNSECDGPCI
jgi:hypothetical protein